MSTPRLRASLFAAAAALTLTACGGGGEEIDSLGYPEGVYPSQGIEWGETLLLFVVVPAAILLVVMGLAWLPGMLRTTRYRPGRGWGAPPLWFGGPPDPVAAVESAETGDVVRGGASGDW